MGKMREEEGVSDLSSKLQLFGVLSKKPFGHQSNKWTKRFFIIKDGYLLYYPDSEKKEFEKRRFFNIHPKGIIPLDGCVVEPKEEQGHPFSMQLKSDDVNGNIILSTESEYEREKWINTLRTSSRVTWRNTQLAEAIIQRLESQGLQMAQEKQDYFNQLQMEAKELHDEKLKTEELERVKEELEQEKQAMEQLALDLKEEYDKARSELDDTVSAMQNIEREKHQLHSVTESLQHTLEELAGEKEKIENKLDERQSETLKLSQEKEDLSQATDGLKFSLQGIEEKMQKLLQEKTVAERRLKEKEEHAQLLEDEKSAISEQALELQKSIKDLTDQKAATEAELKEEVLARLEAERRLRDAESSLARLERAVNKEGTEGRDEAEVQEEMNADVKTLKKFFENLAFESKIDADKPIMIKNSIHARKTFVRRAKTLRYEASRKRKPRDLEFLAPDGLSSTMPASVMSAIQLGEPDFPTRPLAILRHSSTTPTDNRIPEFV